ncbi:TolC family protein [Ramlibacter sp.]|uniref:TolC family protein n=1 Tax=Ramlibacter sp. TaxID=1917967 RepID=UPI002D4C0EB5|nr:TolC family protein [Ramlibacter sp.]HYD75308.1 TolC family protein [Ramlibacter sp.]
MCSFVSRAAVLAAISVPLACAAAPITLPEALQLAVQRSEAARAGRASVVSAGEAAQAVGQLPDPVLGLSLENWPVTGPDRFTTTRENMTMKRIALSQEWVSAQKRSLRSGAANALVAREAAGVAAATADTRLQAALAYIDVYYAAEAVKLGVLNERHAREALETARARLSSSAGSATDVLAFSSSQGMAEDDTADLRQQLASSSIVLARWTGRTTEDLSAPNVPSAPPEQAFLDAHPVVLAKQRELEAARQDAAVAASNRHPNWTWQVAYGQRTGFSDLVTLGVSIPLPVAPAARQDRDTAAKLALIDKAEAELAEATRAAQAEYRQLASEQQHHIHRIVRYEATVLAPAVQRTAAAVGGYRSGQGSLGMVFEARHAELEARRKLLGMQRDIARMQAQLAFRPVRQEDLQ